jgi:hypothetical protein
MKRVKGSRGWIAAAFTILFTVGLIAVQTKAAIQPSGAAPSTLPAPVLSDSSGDGTACPSDDLIWTSVTGATSYQLWSRERRPTPATTYSEIFSGNATFLRVTLPKGSAYAYEAAACDAQGCSGFSNQLLVQNGMCP